MKNSDKAKYAIFLCALALFGFVAFLGSVYALQTIDLGGYYYNVRHQNFDRVAISNVYTNDTANAIFLDVSAITVEDNKIEFISAIIRNATGNIAYVDSLDIALAQGHSATIMVNYNCTLSGVYTITLVTKSGGNFVSPSFTVP